MLLGRPTLPLWQSTLVVTLCIFLAFTPMHDATHMSIATSASGMKWLNTAVGMACALSFGAPFHAFKYMHLQHHKHTNHHELDPDFWSGSGHPWLLPLRWLTQEFRYYMLYLPILHTRSTWEVLLVVGHLAAVWGLVAYTVHAGLFSACLYGWLIPGRIASMLLACTFDYLPHRPHTVTREEDPYKVGLQNRRIAVFDVIVAQLF
jgi:ring-1,2-phenylacetyl-CoA epoxidase subunit PaaE